MDQRFSNIGELRTKFISNLGRLGKIGLIIFTSRRQVRFGFAFVTNIPQNSPVCFMFCLALSVSFS